MKTERIRLGISGETESENKGSLTIYITQKGFVVLRSRWRNVCLKVGTLLKRVPVSPDEERVSVTVNLWSKHFWISRLSPRTNPPQKDNILNPWNNLNYSFSLILSNGVPT